MTDDLVILGHFLRRHVATQHLAELAGEIVG
jgi:hypothetical protein